ncbi:MAG: exo 1,3/1,4-beta-D-glucan glucohydrolase [Luminiphilus sp.]|nr:exo 1,3/1,4-beta-D-glucan glucohydrolase [Luminiphilus sp.]
MACSGSAEPDINDLVAGHLAGMTLQQKVAQMIQGEIKHVTPAAVRRYGLGSVLNGGGSFPDDNKQASIDDWLALADAYHAASTDRSEGNAGIPVIWGTDAVHGHNNVMGATLFPHNVGLGAANDPELIGRIGAATAREVRATGIDWMFAPTLAVATDLRWGRAYESYSGDPALVGQYARQYVSAVQSEGVVATAKHFIGDGGTVRGTDQGDTRLSLPDLLAQHGPGYVSAISANVKTVMASFNSWNGDKIHGNRQLLTDVLRAELGFDGFVVSDWNGIGQVSGCEDDSCARAINAGIDMIMVPEDWESMLHTTVAQVEAGEIPLERIDEAVERILKVKYEMGVMARGLPSESAAQYRDALGAPDHRALAREAVRRSLVLLRNQEGLVPLDPQGTYAVVGQGANDIGMQSGGWTISWQGTGNVNADFPGATSIRSGIESVVNQAGGRVVDVPENDVSLDAAIVVFGEMPYAETQGDIDTLAWQHSSKRDLALIKSFTEKGVPVVSVFLTGRPLWVNAELNASDAFVVAWLPGSEGSGVADLLLANTNGQPRFEFDGRLPMPWPGADLHASNSDLPVEDVLFPINYGLTSSARSDWVALSEEALGVGASLDQVVFGRGVRQPWRLFVGDELDWSLAVGSRGGASLLGELQLSVVDRHVQEDARRVQFTGSGNHLSQVYFQFEEPVDMTDIESAGGALSMELRVLSRPSSSVTLRMDCGWPCSGAVDITPALASMAFGEWRTISVPVACFARRGVDLSQINTPFLMATRGHFSVDIAEIAIREEPAENTVYDCGGFASNS